MIKFKNLKNELPYILLKNKYDQAKKFGQKSIEAISISSYNIDKKEERWIVPSGILCMIFGCLMIYSALFSTGYFIYGYTFEAFVFLFLSTIFSILLYIYSKKLF